MSTNKITLSVFCSVCILALYASTYGDETVLLLTKPFIIPIVYFYYFVNTNRINILFTIALFLCYVGESIVMLELQDPLIAVMIPFFLAYLIFFKLGYDNLIRYKFKNVTLLPLVISFFFLVYLNYSFLKLLSDNFETFFFPFLIFGIVLTANNFVAIYNLNHRMSYANIYYLLACMCFAISDVFYALYHFQLKLGVFNFFDLALQSMCYLFIVLFMIHNEKRIEKN